MTAYAYLRKSSIQGSTDATAEAQERQVRLLADRFGDNHGSLKILSDLDISGQGKYTAKRKGYQELVEAIRDGRASAVYSYSLSRLGRSVAELDRFFSLCAERQVPVRLVADSVDTSTASGRLTMNVLASVAQFEAEVASERVLTRIALKVAKGERVGAPGYGQKPGEDLNAVLAAFGVAGSFRGAARLLNERKVPSRHGGPWGASSVSAVVRKANPAIKAPKRGVRMRGAFTLSRLLICGTCATPLTGTRQFDKRKAESPVVRIIYECHRGHDIPHPKRSIHEPAILPAIKSELLKWQPADYSEIVGDPATRDKRIEDFEAQRLRILDMYQSGAINKQERELRLGKVNGELSRLDTYRVDWIVMPLSAQDFDRFGPAEMNAVLRALLDRIDLDPVTYAPTTYHWREEPEADYLAAHDRAEAEWQGRQDLD